MNWKENPYDENEETDLPNWIQDYLDASLGDLMNQYGNNAEVFIGTNENDTEILYYFILN